MCEIAFFVSAGTAGICARGAHAGWLHLAANAHVRKYTHAERTTKRPAGEVINHIIHTANIIGLFVSGLGVRQQRVTH